MQLADCSAFTKRAAQNGLVVLPRRRSRAGLQETPTPSLPDVLIAHLKASSTSPAVLHGARRSEPVSSPSRTSTCASSRRTGGSTGGKCLTSSRLEHMGTQHGGHYTAVVKNHHGQWYSCNDSSVSEATPSPASRPTPTCFPPALRAPARWGHEAGSNPSFAKVGGGAPGRQGGSAGGGAGGDDDQSKGETRQRGLRKGKGGVGTRSERSPFS